MGFRHPQVLVDESVAGGVSSDRLAGPIRDDALVVGSALSETAVRSTGVVVRDVFAEEVLEVWAVPDESAVEEFVAHRAHPSFRVRVRDGRVGRGADDCRAVASEDLVEGGDELAGAVADQKPDGALVSHHEVPRGLGRP